MSDWFSTIYHPIYWFIWAGILLAQQSTFLFSSRAKNSGSLRYSFIAGLGSHSTWYWAQMIFVLAIVELREASIFWKLGGWGFYVLFCNLGTVAAQHFAKRWEKGASRVGA